MTRTKLTCNIKWRRNESRKKIVSHQMKYRNIFIKINSVHTRVSNEINFSFAVGLQGYASWWYIRYHRPPRSLQAAAYRQIAGFSRIRECLCFWSKLTRWSPPPMPLSGSPFSRVWFYSSFWSLGAPVLLNPSMSLRLRPQRAQLGFLRETYLETSLRRLSVHWSFPSSRKGPPAHLKALNGFMEVIVR